MYSAKDIDYDRVSMLAALQSAAMASSLGVGKQLEEVRVRVKRLESQLRDAESEMKNLIPSNSKMQIPRSEQKTASIRGQLSAAISLHNQLKIQRADLIQQAASLNAILRSLRTVLLKNRIALDVLDAYGRGESSIGVAQ